MISAVCPSSYASGPDRNRREGGETVLVEIDGHMPVLDPDRHLLPYLGVPDPGFALTVTMPAGF